MMPWPLAMRRLLNDAFLQAGCIPPEPVIETSTLFSHIPLATAACALTMLQSPMASLALASGNLIRLKVEDVPGIGPVAIVTRKGRPPSPALQAFMDAARAETRPAGSRRQPATEER